ncbi:pyridoxal phosphate-dependent aminotransferase family protein [Sphingobacterium sp. JB170]|uniref:aminotransferase class I/II-fold pyridoxal phosphate-dependent enzyme n=1 Tax=Sphingobacterium sp. JB170 TaxID=1434842 RepID=UPI000B35296E|nr:pyridoxal phosphate-dependent aminotransferase family protein [Sphingobacterium sp. JB170]
MKHIHQRLTSKLHLRAQRGNLRELHDQTTGIDFYSNDYLGFARSTALAGQLATRVEECSHLMGAGGARLIAGDSPIITQVEEFIAHQHRVQRALLLPSGFAANLSLFSTLPQRGDTIILDERVHHSVYQGCRLSHAKRWKFAHNDLQHLSDLLARSSGQVWIGVESLYSMDGDFAPLEGLVALAEKYGAALIVDEAHAIGVFGLGLLDEQNLQERVFASVVTYGKAMGLWGATILGSRTLANYLINYAGPLIYSTGIPDFHALAIEQAYRFLDQEGKNSRAELKAITDHFNTLDLPCLAAPESPIKPILFSDVAAMERASRDLKQQDIVCYGVRPPTVPSGRVCLRISLHAFNLRKETMALSTILKKHIYG